MTMAPFDELFPDLARSESRALTVTEHGDLAPARTCCAKRSARSRAAATVGACCSEAGARSARGHEGRCERSMSVRQRPEVEEVQSFVSFTRWGGTSPDERVLDERPGISAMTDDEIIAALRSQGKGLTAVEVSDLLERLTGRQLSQGVLATYFKRAFPAIPLQVLLQALAWERVCTGGLGDERFNELLRPWLGSGEQDG